MTSRDAQRGGADRNRRAIGRSGIVGSALAGDNHLVLGQIVGDREPRRLVNDKRVRVGADAWLFVEWRQRDTIERHGAGVSSTHCASVRQFSPARAPPRALQKSAMRARCGLVERDHFLADGEAENRPPRPAPACGMARQLPSGTAGNGNARIASGRRQSQSAPRRTGTFAQHGHTGASLVC